MVTDLTEDEDTLFAVLTRHVLVAHEVHAVAQGGDETDVCHSLTRQSSGAARFVVAAGALTCDGIQRAQLMEGERAVLWGSRRREEGLTGSRQTGGLLQALFCGRTRW